VEGGKLLDSYLGDSGTKSKAVPKIITKILLSLIFLFGSLIFTSLKDEYLVLYKKYVFDETFNFMEFKKFYNKIAGIKKTSEDVMVMGNALEYTDIKPHLNGQSLEIETDVPISVLSGGIVVFVGEKEGFNNTVIIQGSDGYDIWYGNLENIDAKIYDYIDRNKIIASASDNLYLLITKDSKYYTYEEYQTQV